MAQNHDRNAQMALDAAQQYAEEMAQINETLSSTKFHDRSASVMADFEKLEEIETESAQRKIDAEKSNIQTAETLQQMNDHIQELQAQMLQQQNENAKQGKASKIRELVTIALAALSFLATVIIGVVTILLQLRQQ